MTPDRLIHILRKAGINPSDVRLTCTSRSDTANGVWRVACRDRIVFESASPFAATRFIATFERKA